MRLWSLHPSLLDRQGLVALWREALLAQQVLCGRTRGYRRHPQLLRFQACASPEGAIAAYLSAVRREASRRGYSFDGTKIMARPSRRKIAVTDRQLAFERAHLAAKLARRDPAHLAAIRAAPLTTHPLFVVVPGAIEDWERT